MNDTREKIFINRLPKSYVCLSDMVGEFIDTKAGHQNTGEVWAAIVGEKLADHCELLDIKNGTLFIEADHPAVTQSLMLNKSKILAAVNERYPDFKVTKLRCTQKKNYAKKSVHKIPAANAHEERPAPKNTAADAAQKTEHTAGKSIVHEELRKRFERLMNEGKQ